MQSISQVIHLLVKEAWMVVHSELWGSNYRHTANENMMVVAQIESPK